MAGYYDNNTIFFHNGAFVAAKEAGMGFYSHSVHYRFSVSEKHYGSAINQ